MNRFLVVTLFLLNSLFGHAVGSEYVGEIVKHVIESVNESVTAQKESSAKDASSDIASQSNVSKSQKLLNKSQQALKSEVDREAFSDVVNFDDLEEYLLGIKWKFLLFKVFKIIMIISLSIFIWRVSNNKVQKYLANLSFFKTVSMHSSAGTQSLIKTVSPIVKSVFHWVFIILTLLIVLSELNVNIMPVIFGFSIVGVAFTIGSQTLMKDLVNGILMLFEGNVAVGDAVIIGDKTGTVESLSLRALLLRHFTGELQTIPLSEVASLINCSRDFSYAIIQFVVDPKALIPDIQAALNETYESMKKDPKFGSYISGELGSLGVKKMSEVGVTMGASVLIKPDPTKDFLSEFNRRFYERLQAHEVPLAYARL
jgi:small-conductance mechanosensitive channel